MWGVNRIIVNAYITYRDMNKLAGKANKDMLNHAQFRESLAKDLAAGVTQFGEDADNDEASSKSSSDSDESEGDEEEVGRVFERTPKMADVEERHQYRLTARHRMQRHENPRRCKLCAARGQRKRSLYMCETCCLTLCCPD